MKQLMSSILNKNKIPFKAQTKSNTFSVLKSLGKDIKEFNFVIKTNITTYLSEVKYYNGGGSKLNETARAYSVIASKINQYNDFEFVWITDGHGWYSAKNKLNEAFNKIPKLYNLASIGDFINIVKKELV